MPLKLAHHKSYHPYNRENIERVRKDEEKARLEKELEVQVNFSNQSEARLKKLKKRTRGDDRLSPEIAKEENLSNFKEESDSITNKDGSINFWSTIEDEQSKKSRKNKEKRDTESFEDGLGMKFRRPASRWYDTGGDLSKAQDQDDLSRKRKMKEEKNDQKLKISEDPLTDIQAALSIQPKGKSQSTSQSSKSTKSKRMKREEIEHARAKSLLSSSSKR